MIFSLDVRRARQGDCLLLHFGSSDDPGLAIIDGGPASVYKPHLKPRLLAIRKARGLAANEPLPVDLLMVSHVDDDHLQGLLDLTGEMTASSSAPMLRVLNFWHNSFDEIIGNDPAELTAAVAAQFGAASLKGALPAGATVDSTEDEEVVVSNLKVLASIAQGHRLRGDAEKLGFPLNLEFDGKLILAGKEVHDIANGLTCTVAGPMKPELLKLQKDHDKWLKTQKKSRPEAALAAYIDKSVSNLSSIVALVKADGKRILLTGDARGDKILKGLELSKIIKTGGAMHVDILKVPHHGSANNLEKEFFSRVTADHYVFSGDGQHGNPEREAFEMLFAARGKQPFTIHLTYPIDEIDVLRKQDWDEHRQKELKKGTKPPRPVWSRAKHSLAAFFEKHPLAAGQKISIVDAKKPHVIDLLDPLGF
jgi:hypothetical protein